MNKSTSPTFASLVQEFFTDYMVQQRALSPRTVACYRDSFSLLLGFAKQRLGKAPTTLQLALTIWSAIATTRFAVVTSGSQQFVRFSSSLPIVISPTYI